MSSRFFFLNKMFVIIEKQYNAVHLLWEYHEEQKRMDMKVYGEAWTK